VLAFGVRRMRPVGHAAKRSSTWRLVKLTQEQCDALLEIARQRIRGALGGYTAPGEISRDPALSQRAGCFVSLHKLASHQLRGCVGRIEADEPLEQSVAGVSASVIHDPRFAKDPVRLEELDSLELEISVISPLREVASPLQFDPDDDGIYLTIGGRTGCFLPQVARETGWGKEELLSRLCREKMNLSVDAWKDPSARMSVFTTVIIGPVPFSQNP
jgi:AmmeMemoRadiSam system protein A